MLWEKGSACVFMQSLFAAELLPRGLPVAVFVGRGFLEKASFSVPVTPSPCLRRAGGNGGLGDVVRMIADVLDDPENIHIDKARFGVAFLLVQPLDVAVAEFDFEAAQLPGDGGDFARLVGVVVDEAVQRGHKA